MKFFDALPLPNADASSLCDALASLRGADPFGALELFFRLQWGKPAACNFFPKLNNRPAWMRATIDEGTVVLIDGITDVVQARYVMECYAGIIPSGYRNPDNVAFAGWARDVSATMQSFGLFTGNALTIVGYSAGGCIAAHIVDQIRATKSTDAPIRVVSFGSPRAGDTAFANYMRAGCTATRYMNHDDPVPNFPPRSGTFTWVPFAVGIRASMRFANFVHHFGGLVLDAAGNLDEGTVPTHAEITARVALDVYLSDMNTALLGPHSIHEYRRRLAMQAVWEPARRPADFAPTEHTLNTTTREATIRERQSVTAVRDLQQRQDAVAVQIPRVRLAKAVRLGHVWYVILNEVTLMMTPSRRRSQGLARELNAFLRRMQSTAYVDPDALTAQVQNFLAAASDASSGIRPVLSTNIPT